MGDPPLARSVHLATIAPGLGYSGSMSVGGGYIDAEVEAALTQLDPPIIQGWAALVAAGTILAELVALRLVGLDNQQAARTGLLLIVGAPIVWLIAVAIGGFEREVEWRQADAVARSPRWTEDGTPSGPSTAMRRRWRRDTWTPLRPRAMGDTRM